MKNTIFRTAFLCAALLLASFVAANAQGRQDSQVSVRFSVVDASGNPVPGAEVSVGEGRSHYRTDSDGRVSVNCSVKELVSVSADGFKPVDIRAAVLVDSDSVVLVPDILFAGDEDNIE